MQRFDIVKNEWQKMPLMVQARRSHSSCAMNDTVYVFGSSDTYNFVLGLEHHIEKMAQATSGPLGWQKLEIKDSSSTSLPKRAHKTWPLNEEEILILSSSYEASLHILNVKTGEDFEVKDETGESLTCKAVDMHSVKQNSAIIRTMDTFVTYTRGQTRFKPLITNY